MASRMTANCHQNVLVMACASRASRRALKSSLIHTLSSGVSFREPLINYANVQALPGLVCQGALAPPYIGLASEGNAEKPILARPRRAGPAAHCHCVVLFAKGRAIACSARLVAVHCRLPLKACIINQRFLRAYCIHAARPSPAIQSLLLRQLVALDNGQKSTNTAYQG